MGQGGKITLVNSTNSDWKKTYQHSYQMNSWDFPDTISAKTSVSIYVEWDQSIFHNKSDDAGEVNYTLDGSNDVFQVQARATNGFELKICLLDITTHAHQKGAVFSLGWEHNGFVDFILSGTSGNYSSTNLNGSSWMQDNISLLGNKKLNEICITGSHDSGMSVYTSGTAFGFDCNVLTQSRNIQGQLSLGARYFDIRPVISSGKYLTGHYGKIDQIDSWQGGNGQSIDSIIADINSFTSFNNELVILNLSHSLNTDVGNANYRAFDQNEWDALFKKLATLDHLFVAPANTDLTNLTLNDFIANKAAVIIILEENATLGSYAGNGFYQYANYNVYNNYANKNQVAAMATDQFNKMNSQSSSYFLLSWTLTQDATQATTCASGLAPSIKKLANQANQRLVDLSYPQITNSVFPNIIYVDNILTSQAAVMAMAINWKIQ